MGTRKHTVKKHSFLAAALVLVCLWLACGCSAGDSTDPAALYRQNHAIDLFVYEDAAYVRASDIQWVQELVLTPDVLLGEIQRSGVTKRFQDFDSTQLQEQTQIYAAKERGELILAAVDEQYIPYLRYVEG